MMLTRFLGVLQVFLLLCLLAVGIPALIQWRIFNGLDVLAIIILMALGWAISYGERDQ